MARNQWIDKLIPARGEATVSAQIKGSIGAKGSRMRRKPQNRFAKLRKVSSVLAVPFASSSYPNSGVFGEQGQMWCNSVGASTYGTNSRRWLFCIHPGSDVPSGNPFLAGLEDEGSSAEANSASYRIVGMVGSVYWTPTFSAPLSENVLGENCSGMFYGAWLHLKKGMNFTTSTREWEFRRWPESNVTHLVPGVEMGYLPVDVPSASTQAVLDAHDARTAGATMQRFCFPWRADYVYDPSAPTQSALGGAPSYKIPLPRKLVMNVGDQDALALVYWVKDNGQRGGAPDGIFNYADFGVKMHRLD